MNMPCGNTFYLNQEMREQDKRERRQDQINEWIDGRAKDLYHALPDFYTSSNGVKRFTSIEDAIEYFTQDEWIAIARLVRDNQFEKLGRVFADTCLRVCFKQAYDQADDEFDC